jgi:UDP-xylose/UDP-N-acetylglucosamine transporter B4
MPLHIIFRSSGVCVALILGYFVQGTIYSFRQIFGVLLVTLGILATTMASSSSNISSTLSSSSYFIGVGLLTLAVFTSAFLGLLQQHTYGKYGGHWREGLFYTHTLSLPFFLLFYKEISESAFELDQRQWWVLLMNILTQSIV